MKNLLSLSIALLASITLETVGTLRLATAANFGQKEVEQDQFIAIAKPRVGDHYQLLVLEQISKSKACWKESGTNPVNVEPLLLKFDFTGICGRSTDSNGYSMRMAGQDLGMQYSLSLVKRDGDLVLVGTSNTDRNTTVVEIGRTHGINSGFAKIILDPGWRFTKRTYNGKSLGHVYLTNDVAAPSFRLGQQGNADMSTELKNSGNNSSQ